MDEVKLNNISFTVKSPKWIFGLGIALLLLCWTASIILVFDKEPLIVNPSRYKLIDYLLVLLLYGFNLLFPPVALIYFSSQMTVNDKTIKTTKFFGLLKKEFIIDDLIEAKLKNKGDKLYLIFSSGYRISFESTCQNFNDLRDYLKTNNKIENP